MLDLRLIEAFLALTDERSFTRAAQRIDVAQSAISMRIRRLEDVLRFALFVRTSRRVDLTSEGLAFLPQARALLAAEADARAAAREILATHGNSLRIGSYHFLSPFRSRLISRYVESDPSTEILVTYGRREDLLGKLRSRTIDLILGLGRGDILEDEVNITAVGKLYAHLACPPDSSLIGQETVSLDTLAGQEIALMPSRFDQKVLGRVAELTMKHRLRPVFGPETERDAVDAFARARNVPHLSWFSRPRARMRPDGWAVIPFVDDGMCIDLSVMTLGGEAALNVRRFLQVIGAT